MLLLANALSKRTRMDVSTFGTAAGNTDAATAACRGAEVATTLAQALSVFVLVLALVLWLHRHRRSNLQFTLQQRSHFYSLQSALASKTGGQDPES